MAYQKLNWLNKGETGAIPINKTNLNHMDDGIEQNSNDIANIIESGSNSNGNWIKYADGTLICTRSIEKQIPCTATWGSLFYGFDSDAYNFAQEFITPPLLYLFAYQRLSSSFWLSNYYNTIITTTEFHNYAIMRPTSAEAVAYTLNVLAIGRWK